MTHYSKEEVQAAEKGDILQFAEKLGVALTQTGHDELKGVDHDSLVITPSKNSWYWNSRSVGGRGALSFAEDYVLSDQNLEKGEKFLKSMKLVKDSNIDQAELKDIKREPFKFDTKQLDTKFNKAYAYLTKARGLNPKLINELHKQGAIEQDKFGNALFVWKDPETKKVKGVTKQGTWVNHEKYGKRGTLKHIERNSTYGYGFSFDSFDITHGNGKPENLRFFESSIDAMSFYNLNPKKLKNTRFVAMDGLKKEVVANYINLTEKQLAKSGSTLKSIGLGVDNDEAGNKFVEEMQKYQARNREGKTLQIESRQPAKKFGKDWNDALKLVRKMQADVARKKSLERKQHKAYQLER